MRGSLRLHKLELVQPILSLMFALRVNEQLSMRLTAASRDIHAGMRAENALNIQHPCT